MTATALDTEGLVARIDAAWGAGWYPYRSALGHWVIGLAVSGGPSTTVQGASLTAVLNAAAETRPMTVVPRRPSLIACTVERVKSGGSTPWCVRDERGDFLCAQRTKRDAEFAAERMEAARRAALEDWNDKWLGVTAGAEGTDWTWQR